MSFWRVVSLVCGIYFILFGVVVALELVPLDPWNFVILSIVFGITQLINN